MSNLFKGVRCLTQEQYEQLKNDGTITIDGETYLFEEDWLYVTPEDVSGIARNNKKRLDSLSKDYEATKLVVAENKNNITLLKSNHTTISNDLREVKNDINDLIATSVTLEGAQTIKGPKTFTENIYLANADGTVDRISHINNNFIIYSGAEQGVALLNIDEGLDKIYAFNKELAFKEDLTDSGGSKVYVSGELKESVSFDEDPQTQITQNTNYINDSKKSIEFAESEMQKSKNLLDLSSVPTTDTIKPNGTGLKIISAGNNLNTGGGTYNICLEANTSYTVSGNLVSTTQDGRLDIRWFAEDGTFYWGPNFDGSDLVVYFDKKITQVQLYIQYYETAGAYVEVTNFQIEKGGAATAYQPYSGAIIHKKDILNVEHIDTIYDMNSSNADLNWGYTNGILNTTVYRDFSKYKRLRFYYSCKNSEITTDTFGRNNIIELDLTTLINGEYSTSNQLRYVRQNEAYTGSAFFVVNANKTYLYVAVLDNTEFSSGGCYKIEVVY